MAGNTRRWIDFLRHGEWLQRERTDGNTASLPNSNPGPTKQDRGLIRSTMLLGGYAFAATTLFYLATVRWTGAFPRDATTLVIGRDFIDFWVNGQAAWTANPGRLYNLAQLARSLAVFVGSDYPGQGLFYPPPCLLLAAPFGLLPYFVALLLWTILGIGMFVWAIRRFLPDRQAATAVVLSPAAMFCVMSGQISFVFASIVLTVFSQLDRRPLLAGFLTGFLSIKPQYFILFPLLFIGSGRWRALLGTSLALVLLCTVTLAIWGPRVWLEYFSEGMLAGNLVLSDPKMIVAPFMPTIFMNLRVAGLGPHPAMVVQTILAVLAAASFLWICWVRRRNDLMTAALLLGCLSCSVPYLLCYDSLALTTAAIALVAAGRLDGTGRRLAQLVYWLPLLQMGLGVLHIPGAALAYLAFTGYIFMQAASEINRVPRAVVPAHGG